MINHEQNAKTLGNPQTPPPPPPPADTSQPALTNGRSWFTDQRLYWYSCTLLIKYDKDLEFKIFFFAGGGGGGGSCQTHFNLWVASRLKHVPTVKYV